MFKVFEISAIVLGAGVTVYVCSKLKMCLWNKDSQKAAWIWTALSNRRLRVLKKRFELWAQQELLERCKIKSCNYFVLICLLD